MSVFAPTIDTAWPSASSTHTVTSTEVAAFRRVARAAIEARAGATGGQPSAVHVAALLATTAARAGRQLLGELDPLPVPVHLSEEIRVHRPLRVGEQLLVTADVLGARPDPRGGRLALRSRVTIPDGAAVAEALTTVLLLGDITLPAFGHVPLLRGHGGGRWTHVVTRVVPDHLASRYAEVSGSDHPIHLHHGAARSAGFDHPVVQGMALLALACEEIVDRYADGDQGRVRTVGARFATAVAPGDRVELALSDAAGGIVHFRATTRRGVAVRKAWVELARDAREARS